MKPGQLPEVCTGVYFPLSGKPQRGYYVVLDEIVLGGPFKRKSQASEQLKKIYRRGVNQLASRSASKNKLQTRYARSIDSVLREQEKALTAVMGAAS
jgi:hypothetical protein